MLRPSCVIVLATDERFVPGAAALLASLAHAGGVIGVAVTVYECGVSGESKELLRRTAQQAGLDLTIAEPMPVPDSYPMGTRFSQAAFVRLQLPSLLYDFDRILYLDSDTLVTGSLAELIGTDLGRRPFAAAAEYFQGRVGSVPNRRPRRTLFNSGVLLIDGAAWRERSISARVDEFIRANPDACRFAEQDALNAVMPEWMRLDARWNFYPLVEHFAAGVLDDFRITEDERHTLVQARRDARIIHFIGPVKPWDVKFPAGSNASAFRASLQLARLAHDKRALSQRTAVGRV
jgi:lipopolysaccharide biosynthesis glycosyltransferase